MSNQVKLVLKSHSVCRGPDGVIKWEADTVPVEVSLGVAAELARSEVPVFTIDTTAIRTGEEHL